MAITPQKGYMVDPLNQNQVIRDPNQSSLSNPVISASSLTPQAPITLPPKPLPTAIDTTGAQATIDSVTNSLAEIQKQVDENRKLETQKTPETPTEPSFLSSLKESLGLVPKPESSADIYSQTYGITPEQARLKQEQAQTDFNTKQQSVRTAKAKFDAVNARLSGLSAQSQKDILALEGQGRGITKDILTRQAQETARQYAIQALPLQAEALIAQAEMASAQGEVELSQEMLKQAGEKLDELFTAKQQDAQNDFSYRMKVFESIEKFLDKREQRIADEKKTELTRKQKVEDDLRDSQKELANFALENRQGSLSTTIASLDISSPTFEQDLARLRGKIKIYEKPEAFGGGVGGVGDKGIISGLTPEQQADPFIKLLASTAGGKPITDTFAQSLNKGLNVLGQIGGLQTNIKDTNTGPLLGLFRGANPWDTNAQTIKAQLNAIVPNLARGVYGEVGVLTDNDIAQYSKTLPNLKSTEDIRNAVLGITVDLIGKSIKRTLEINAANQKDVSGFIDIYTEMTATRDSIFSQIPGYKGAGTQSLQSLGISLAEEDIFNSVVGTTPQTTSGGGFFSNIWKGLTGQ